LTDIYFVGRGELALINAAIANSDGRGPLKYFLGSLFVGPLVMVILAAMREGERGDLRQIDLWGRPRVAACSADRVRKRGRPRRARERCRRRRSAPI